MIPFQLQVIFVQTLIEKVVDGLKNVWYSNFKLVMKLTKQKINKK